MNVSLSDLANIQNGGAYYLSDQGEVKQAGLWTKFKYALNLGHSRERATNLLNAIGKALLESAGMNANHTLTEKLNDIDTAHGMQGDDIKQLLSEFKATNQEKINSATARRAATQLINKSVKNLNDILRVVKTPELKELFLMSCKSITDNPPLIGNSQDAVDTNALESSLKDVIKSFEMELVKIATSQKLKNFHLSSFYARYLQDTLFTKAGARTNVTLEDLKSPGKVFEDLVIKQLGSKTNENRNLALKETAAYLFSQFAPDDGEIGLHDDTDDLNELLIGGYRNILTSGDGKLRPLETVKQKIEGIRKNYNEIAHLKETSPRHYSTALNTLKQLNGKSLPEGCITKCLELCRNVPLNQIKTLNGNSSQFEIYKTLAFYAEQVSEVLKESGILSKIEGADELNPVKELTLTCILAGLTDDERMTLSQAVSSLQYAKLHAFLIETESENMKGNPSEKNLSIAIFNDQISDMDLLKGSLQFLMGKDKERVPNYVGLNKNTSEYNAILDDVQAEAHRQITSRVEAYVSSLVKGNSADFIKQQMTRRIMEKVATANLVMVPFSAEEAFSVLASKAVTSSVSSIMVDSVRKAAANQTTQFEKDLGKIQISLPDNRKLSGDINTALDELADLISGGNGTKYADLDDKGKKKVQIITSLLSGDLAKAATKGLATSLDTKQKQPIFTASGDGLPANTDISVTRDTYNNLEITLKHRAEFSNLAKSDGSVIAAGAGSVQNTELELTIGPEELDRLAELDFNQPDQQIEIKNTSKSNLSVTIR